MATLNLRLPERLNQKLSALAAQTHQNRSDLARTALEVYLQAQERERLIAEMEAAFRVLATNPQACAESAAINAEFVSIGDELSSDTDAETWWK